MANKKLKLTLVRSTIGRVKSHRDCLRGLGLKRMHQTVEREDTPEIRGMVKKVAYMLNIEEVE